MKPGRYSLSCACGTTFEVIITKPVTLKCPQCGRTGIGRWPGDYEPEPVIRTIDDDEPVGKAA